MEWYLSVIQDHYADFSGRARRTEYWMFTLFNMLALIPIGILAFMSETVGGLVAIVYLLAMVIPSLAVAVRRLHDTGRSGWWLLLSFVPAGGLVLFVFYVLEGNSGANEFGPDPKDPYAEDFERLLEV